MDSLLGYGLALAGTIAATVMRGQVLRQCLWLAASYALYATFGTRFLAVLVVSSLFNFIYAKFLRRNPTSARLAGGIAANVSLLGFYKATHVLAWTIDADPVVSAFLRGIVMPIGISFWTFQAVSYLFDLYRQEDVDPSLVEFCLYMAFWPTVIMGPICRLENMLPQFRERHGFSSENLIAGATRVVTGLFMKVVLSQLMVSGLTAGTGVAAGFDRTTAVLSGLDVWCLAIGFGFQLFFDFAGYSHIVIGAARIFGFRLEENFASPYLASTPSEFWTRWHMSLSSWIRDYVFVPVAAARSDIAWRYCALAVSMTLFGLWHGVQATFVLWGVYHGLLLIAHRVIQQRRRRMTFALSGRIDSLLSWLASFLAISLGWVLFRSNDLGQALSMLRAAVTPWRCFDPALGASYYLLVLTIAAGYFAYHTVWRLSCRWIASSAGPDFRAGLARWGLTPQFATVLWFIPMAGLLFLGMLIVHSGSEGMAPFVYAVF